MQTARFKNLVARCGQPEIHLSWSLPTKDKVLQRAVAQNRLLTVHQEGDAAKKDYATVGLHPGKFVQYLLFPKSLRPFVGRRIVGIDYHSFGQQLSVSVPEAMEGRIRSGRVSRPSAKTGAPAKIVPFEAASQPPKTTPLAPSKRDHPSPPAPLVLLKPWFEEVAEAITELKKGHHQAAQSRLQSLLRRNGLKT